MLAGEDMFIETFSTARVHDARLVALRDKVKVLPHADWNGVSMASDNSIIVRMKDGRSFTRSCVAHRGNPRDPLTQGEMVARFEKCVVPILSRARSATLAQVILALEVERNVAALPALFTPSA